MLSNDVSRYIELHRELGYKFRLQASYLQHFTAFAEARGDDFVRVTTALAWASNAPSVEQRRERLAVVRRFALQMRIQNECHEVPPARAFGCRTRRQRKPHIYSPEEINRLLEAAGGLGPADSIRSHTYMTLFALLVATGLRISEALGLNVDDITADGLVIRHTKFRKSRLVPLHSTAAHGLERYLTLRNQCSSDDCAVFLSLWEKRLSYTRTNAIFLRLMRSIGLRGKPGTPGPCIHDLRHTFAVRSLEGCHGGSAEVDRHILALSTYLGHSHPSDTYWYLQATPRLMASIAEMGESFFRRTSS